MEANNSRNEQSNKQIPKQIPGAKGVLNVENNSLKQKKPKVLDSPSKSEVLIQNKRTSQQSQKTSVHGHRTIRMDDLPQQRQHRKSRIRRSAGLAFSWLSNVCYLFGRFPQIITSLKQLLRLNSSSSASASDSLLIRATHSKASDVGSLMSGSFAHAKTVMKNSSSMAENANFRTFYFTIIGNLCILGSLLISSNTSYGASKKMQVVWDSPMIGCVGSIILDLIILLLQARIAMALSASKCDNCTSHENHNGMKPLGMSTNRSMQAMRDRWFAM